MTPTYERIYSNAEQSAYDLPAAPLPTAPASAVRTAEHTPPPSAVRHPASSDQDTESPVITDKNHPLWRAWLDAERRARIAGVDFDTADVQLGHITEASLRASIDALEGMIADATDQQNAQQTALPT